MNALNLLPVFVVGLAGSVHCIGMCGGIVGALSAAPGRARPSARVIPIVPAAFGAQPTALAGVDLRAGQGAAAAAAPGRASGAGAAFATSHGSGAGAGSMPGAGTTAGALPCAEERLPAGGTALRILAYNTGRIGSYMLAGAIAGGLAGGAASLARIAAWQSAAYWLANLMLVALGLYLSGAWRGLAYLETLGGKLWRKVTPLLRRLLPMDTPWKALALGGLWGWVPCAMVYSVLLTSALSGSPAQGAAVMLAFGLGTLPMLAALGLLGAQVRLQLQRRAIRVASGLLVLAFGLLGLLRASGAAAPLLQAFGLPDAGAHGWLDAFCAGGQP
ncbi:sulfite exporter TauE/SafE family protein [Pseudoduganella sp. LjRoot289]|uniref:sulfite exporter TauE/SafE family protein n=1 Tax=Pseudoduganella sp. LjRoot289 TaxID=3342314 RepID=UPI003ECE4FA2